VNMCKGKRRYDHEALMTSSLSDCTWLEKEWKFRLSTMWHPCLHFYFFLLLDSSLSYLSCHSSFLFLFFLFLSYTYFSLSLRFYIFFFLSILILFSLFFPLLTSFQSSQLLSFLHAHNLKF
jgi:hypothetical protein